MACPPENEWVLVSELAKMMGCSKRTALRYMSEGLLSRGGGERVVLDSWKTMKGRVTTKRAVRDFHDKLNR